MKRSLVSAFVLCIAFGAVLAAPVLGGQPARDPTPPPVGTVIEMHSGECPFDVDMTILQNRESTLTFTNGAQIITGKLIVNLKNVDPDSAGRSIDLNVSGPGF